MRLVVPKQGMDTAWIPLRSRPSRSKARAVTSRARVESSPPERPTTAVLQWICPSRVARPTLCMVKIRWHRSERPTASWGTKGVRAKSRWGTKAAKVPSS